MRRTRTPLFTIRSVSLLENAIKNAESMEDGGDDVLNSIVMSCASAEAFVNEVDYWSAINGLQSNRLDDRGRLIRVSINGKIEQTHQKFERVLSQVMPSFSTKNNPFAYLYKQNTGLSYLRNRIVHQNYLDEFAKAGSNEHYDRLLSNGCIYDEVESPTQMVMPPDVMKLYRLNLLKPVSKDSWASWFEIIKSKKLAWWVCSTTRNAIIEVLTDAKPDISEGFISWRKLATAELPPIDLEERIAGDTELKAMLTRDIYGAPSFVYAVMPDNQIVFTKASGTEVSGSSMNYAETIIEGIIKNEKINPIEFDFLDLHTHFNGGYCEDGEYEIYRVKLEPQQEEVVIRNWTKVAKAKIVNRELHVFKGEDDPRIASIINKFSSFIGKPAPF